MLKASRQPAGNLLAISIDNTKVVNSSGKNNGKSTKSDFTTPVRRVEKPSFQTLDARQVFN